MTNDPAPPPRPAEPTGSDALAALARTEKRMVRLTFWQTLLSVAGALIAILALFATLRESEEVRRQTAAAVWPYVQVQMNDFDQGDEAALSLSFTNTGVGPAKVRTLRMEVDGQPVPDWAGACAGRDRAGVQHPASAPGAGAAGGHRPGGNGAEPVLLLDLRRVLAGPQRRRTVRPGARGRLPRPGARRVRGLRARGRI